MWVWILPSSLEVLLDRTGWEDNKRCWQNWTPFRGKQLEEEFHQLVNCSDLQRKGNRTRRKTESGRQQDTDQYAGVINKWHFTQSHRWKRPCRSACPTPSHYKWGQWPLGKSPSPGHSQLCLVLFPSHPACHPGTLPLSSFLISLEIVPRGNFHHELTLVWHLTGKFCWGAITVISPIAASYFLAMAQGSPRMRSCDFIKEQPGHIVGKQ